MGKKNNQIKRFFFYKICQPPNLHSTLRVLNIEFNSLKFSFVRCVFVEYFANDANDPENNKNSKISQFQRFDAIFVNFLIDIVD